MVSGIQEARERRYWLFQASPRGDDLRDFLRGEAAGKALSWRIPRYKNPKDHMKAGDGVVLWQSPGTEPQASGVYALGSLTGRFPARGREAQFLLDAVRELSNPIATESLRHDLRLRDLAVLRPKGNQGPCFKLNERHWAAFAEAWGTPTRAPGRARMLSLPVQVPHVTRTEVNLNYTSYDSERREARLVLEYVHYP